MAAGKGSEHHNVKALREAKVKVLEYISQGLSLEDSIARSGRKPDVMKTWPRRCKRKSKKPLFITLCWSIFQVNKYEKQERARNTVVTRRMVPIVDLAFFSSNRFLNVLTNESDLTGSFLFCFDFCCIDCYYIYIFVDQ